MKNTKLITILISLLVFSLLTSAFVTGAVGSEDNGAITPYDAMVTLGYIDGLERNDTLTRIDALITLFRITGVENDAASYDGGAAFLDVGEGLSSYASYAAEKGISVGDGYSFFSPFRPVTLQEMLILTLRALGYSDVDMDNVYDLAKEAGLYVYTDQDDLYYYLTVGRMAEILWNLLNTAPSGSDATFADLLIELEELDESLYNEMISTVTYVFGDTTNASTAARTDTESIKPETSKPVDTKPDEPEGTYETEENEGWSPIWKPGSNS